VYYQHFLFCPGLTRSQWKQGCPTGALKSPRYKIKQIWIRSCAYVIGRVEPVYIVNQERKLKQHDALQNQNLI
jgi:hypothetical protein